MESGTAINIYIYNIIALCYIIHTDEEIQGFLKNNF